VTGTSVSPPPGAHHPSRAVHTYLGVSAAVLVLYLGLGPLAQDIVYDAVGIVAVGLMASRVMGWRSLPDPRPWALLGAGLACFVVADLVWDLYTYGLGIEDPFPSAADAFYLGAYPFLVAGVVVLARRQGPGRDRSNLIDALVLVTGVGVVCWVYVVGPLTTDPDLSALGRAISIAYPLMDLVLLVTLVELALLGGLATPARKLLALSMGAVLAADAAYTVALLAGTYADGSLIDLGWLGSYVLLAAAALHGSAAEEIPRRPAGPAPLGRGRLGMLCGAALSGLVVLCIEQVRGSEVNVWVIAVSSVLLFVLVVARLVGVTRALALTSSNLERSLADERVLREAAATLVVASDRPAIEAAASRAGSELGLGGVRIRPVPRSHSPPEQRGRASDDGLEPKAGPAALAFDGTDSASEATSVAAVLASMVGLALDREALAADLARQAVVEERMRLAREIHDVVSHGLATMVMGAGAARRTDGDAGVIRARLGEIERQGRDAMVEMRRMLAALGSSEDALARRPHPGLSSLACLVDGVRSVGLAVEMEVSGNLDDVPASVGLSAYRIVQEALTNVGRHARNPSRAVVSVRRGDGALEVCICDDGTPQGADNAVGSGGQGLRGMAQRVHLLGGRFEAGPLSEGGFRVYSSLPLE
jgi:signal transduction histidine kinase